MEVQLTIDDLIPAEIALSEAAAARITGHLNMINSLGGMVGGELCSLDGLSEQDAMSVVAQAMIRAAAVQACLIRRTVLGGEPDPERWRAVCEEAFRLAVKWTAPLADGGPHP